MYIDEDGETILETPEELKHFLRGWNHDNRCSQCAMEAFDMLNVVTSVYLTKLVFSTKCHHGR